MTSKEVSLMTCRQAERLVLRILAEPREELVEHLASCDHCQKRFAVLEAILTGEPPSLDLSSLGAECLLLRDEIPLYLELGETEGAASLPAVAAHLATCPDCQERVRFLRNLEEELAEPQESPLVSPSLLPLWVPAAKASGQDFGERVADRTGAPVRAQDPMTRERSAQPRPQKLALAASVLMVVFTSLFSWQKVQAAQKATARAERQHLEMTEIANRAMTAAQKSDLRAFADAVEAFDLGDTATVPRATLSVGGTVRYPRSCPRYWLLFSEHRAAEGITVIWPQLAVRNRGLVSQEIAQRVTVPREMDAGELVLVCADETTHERFSTWRNQTGSSPLLAPDLEIVLRTQLTIE